MHMGGNAADQKGWRANLGAATKTNWTIEKHLNIIVWLRLDRMLYTSQESLITTRLLLVCNYSKLRVIGI